MKVAQVKYTHTNGQITLGIYFDNKAFEFISPPMNETEENHFIRLIGDSLAAGTIKDSPEKYFYVKRAVKYTDTNTLKLLITNGFLIDSSLILPITPQAFADERINIEEIGLLPARLRLSNDVIKNINDRLPLFEEEVRKELGQGKLTVAKEIIKQEKPEYNIRKLPTDKSTDVLSEIGNIKKDMKEIAESSIRNLKALIVQIDGIRQRVFDTVMKETQSTLDYKDNKSKLDEFAKTSISQFGGGDIEKIKTILTEKINEMTPIVSHFDSEIEEMTQRILKQTTIQTRFKEIAINALYDTAEEFSPILMQQIATAAPHAKKTMLTEFNKKFTGIATLSESGKLSTREEAQSQLGNLTLESLQEIISNEDKEHPGVLQKCNTSWVDEAPELQILMKHLGKLNAALSQLFIDDPEYGHYAKTDMVQVTRIPFPRSFQFKFSNQALAYKDSVDTFCRAQKDKIVSIANSYKKILQINEIRDKTQRAIADIQRQTESMKKPVSEFRDLLKLKEASGDVMSSASKEHEITNQLSTIANQLLEDINTKVDISFKMLRKKISVLVADIQEKANDINKVMQNIILTKSQIDLAIHNFNSQPNSAPNLRELNDKIKSMSDNHNIMIEQNKSLQTLSSKLKIYDQALNNSDKITLAISQSDMRKQHNESKSFLLQFITSQSGDSVVSEEQRKNVIEIFTHIDTNIAAVDKISQELIGTKNQLFNSLNARTDLSQEEMQTDMIHIEGKIEALEQAKSVVNDNITTLRKLALESTMEKK